jgi:3-isopropylmalate dehydratase small subunit
MRPRAAAAHDDPSVRYCDLDMPAIFDAAFAHIFNPNALANGITAAGAPEQDADHGQP